MKKKFIFLASGIILIIVLIVILKQKITQNDQPSQIKTGIAQSVIVSTNQEPNLNTPQAENSQPDHVCLKPPLPNNCYDIAVQEFRTGDKILAQEILNLTCADGHIPSCYRIRDYKRACRFGDTHACKIAEGRKKLVPFERK